MFRGGRVPSKARAAAPPERGPPAIPTSVYDCSGPVRCPAWVGCPVSSAMPSAPVSIPLSLLGMPGCFVHYSFFPAWSVLPSVGWGLETETHGREFLLTKCRQKSSKQMVAFRGSKTKGGRVLEELNVSLFVFKIS